MGGAGGTFTCRGGTVCVSPQICVESTYIPNTGSPINTTACKDNPCGTNPLACSCAKNLCVSSGAGDTVCSVETERILGCQSSGTCASPETGIATPEGERRIADLLPGDLVYSVHQHALQAVPLLQVSRTPVHNHHVVRVTTEDGAVIEMSAGHPTADGRSFGQLKGGDLLDGASIVSSRVIPYLFSETYDILPASDTGTYVASGHLVGSTLKCTQ